MGGLAVADHLHSAGENLGAGVAGAVFVPTDARVQLAPLVSQGCQPFGPQWTITVPRAPAPTEECQRSIEFPSPYQGHTYAVCERCDGTVPI